ncbi:MAG: metal-dependent transcriptional regulator [Candidatus Omnitrophica bacterium]|nr:metal-dependent transcriptional regulator [Candidatus Omnitrophota bacterium]
MISDRAEEILETLWVNAEEENHKSVDLGIAKNEPAIDELCKSGHIKLINEKITLTDKGRNEGGQVVRRHRLAERLFTDVLDIKTKLIHPVSCQFEHLLHEGIEDNICILLGHPKICPHGKQIPEGECCKKFKEKIGKVVSSLNNMEASQKGKVVYIHTRDHKKLQKLMAMSILPGMTVSLIQKFPSYVFQIGQSQFAVDKELAECIFVRTGV